MCKKQSCEMSQENVSTGEHSSDLMESELMGQSQEKSAAGKQLHEQPVLLKQSTGPGMELCWYCMKSHSLAEFNTPQLQTALESKALMPPHGEDRLSYQQDPRPHFGVAHSSRSTAFPLWGSEGHREARREADEDAMYTVGNCPHCHLGLPLDTLHWHAEKCLVFDGTRNDK